MKRSGYFMKRLWFQRCVIFLDLSRGMVRGGPGWWSQVKDCWAESERVQLRRLYGKYLPAIEAFMAGARALNRVVCTMAEAFRGVRAAFAKAVPAFENAWREAHDSATAKKGQRRR